MPKGKFIPLTEEQEQFIKDNYLKYPVKRLADMLGVSGGTIDRRLKKFGLIIPAELIEKRKRDSQKKKGSVPFNKGLKQSDYMSEESIRKTEKTRFKKGNKPHNTNYNGHKRISKDGYVEVRIRKGVYVLEHIFKWEQVNGKIKGGYCLKCLDGNKKNTNPSNWKMISRSELMYENSRHNYPEEIIPSLVLLNKINNKLKSIENGKK